MLCDNIKSWFNDYLDGDLDVKKKKAIDAHLKQCAHCRQEFERLKRADDCLRREVKRMFKEIPVPGGLQAKIEKRIKESVVRPPLYKRISSWYAGIAAALIIFVVSYGAFSQYHQEDLFPGAMSTTSAPEVVEQVEQVESNHKPAQESSRGEDFDVVVSDQAQINKGGSPAGSSTAGQVQPPIIITPGGDADRGSPAGTDTGVTSVAGQVKMNGWQSESAEQNDVVQMRQDYTAATEPEPLQKQLSARAKESAGKANGTGENAAVTDVIRQVGNNECVPAVVPLTPSYLPEGTILIKSRTNDDGMVCIDYKIGHAQLRLQEQLNNEKNVLPNNIAGGKRVRINGQNGILLESAQTGLVTLIFNQSNLLVTLEGDLPVEEILRIAESLAAS